MKALLALLLLICALTISSNLVAEGPTATEEAIPSPDVFKDKVIYLTIDESNDTAGMGSVVMTKAKIEKIGERRFIVGTGYGGKSGAWYKDMTIGIAWENVTRFAAMTPEQFEPMSEYWSKQHEGEMQ